jgi:prepilin peptidase CpaA
MHAFLIAAVVMTAIAAWTDARKGEIPNWITLWPLGLAPIAHAALAGAREGGKEALIAIAYSVVGAVVCSIVPLILYRMSAIGGGDVKLFAALGAVCMPMLGIEAELYGFVAAALIAPARLAYEGKLFATLGNTARLVVNPILPKAKRKEIDPASMHWFRMGPAILVGTLAAVVANWR